MKRFNTFIIAVLGILVAAWVLANVISVTVFSKKSGKEFMVEINRLSQTVLSERDASALDYSSLHYVERVIYLPADAPVAEISELFDGATVPIGRNYLVKPVFSAGLISGYVRYEYRIAGIVDYRHVFVMINAAFAVVFLFAATLLLYLRSRVIRPFNRIRDLPVELSKGRLRDELKEDRNRLFGRFVWGLNMLRESIDEKQKKEIRLEKDRKTTLLSISHGIKTPLSSIKLYARAIGTDMYKDADSQKEAAQRIEDNAVAIENIIREITETQTENLVEMDVEIGEFYLSEMVAAVRNTYSERLALLQTEFSVGPFPDVLLRADLNRLADVFENLIENAIKYGDGKRISIDFSTEERAVLITVYNSGTPIPASERPYVFDSFWRGSNTNDRPGSGLGLYIAKYLMSKMNGEIYLGKSEEGISFVIVIPMA
jgi:signal transduction histidine kinase